MYVAVLTKPLAFILYKKLIGSIRVPEELKFDDGPNSCRVKKVDVSSTFIKIYFGLGWPSSVLTI